MPDSTAALPADVGLCTCAARNSLRATRCHSCGSTLPWVKAAPEPKINAQKMKAASAVGSSVANAGDEALVSLGVGILVFAAAFIFPFIGLWMYRHFSEEESPLAMFAALGGVLGLGGWIWFRMGRAVGDIPDRNSVSP